MLRYIHGPYEAAEFKDADGAPTDALSKSAAIKMDAFASDDSHRDDLRARMPTARTRSSRRRARPTARTSGRAPTAGTRATAAFAPRLDASPDVSREARAPARALVARLSSSPARSRRCAATDAPPTALMDGLEPTSVAGRARGCRRARRADEGPRRRARRTRSPGRRSAACLDIGYAGARQRGPSVERVGVDRRERHASRRAGAAVFGCDEQPRPAGGRPSLVWRRLRSALRRDAARPASRHRRVQTRDGDAHRFVWVAAGSRPRATSRSRQPDYTEVYEPAGGLPVRIATTQRRRHSTTLARDLRPLRARRGGKLLRAVRARSRASAG